METPQTKRSSPAQAKADQRHIKELERDLLPQRQGVGKDRDIEGAYKKA